MSVDDVGVSKHKPYQDILTGETNTDESKNKKYEATPVADIIDASPIDARTSSLATDFSTCISEQGGRY